MFVFWFIVIIVALIVVHELGHFAVAKWLGIRVDEFGIGFPPKILGFKYGETEYTLNLIPFGGFVKIFGEDPDEESMSGPESERSFVNKPKWAQALVLVAGVTFNVLFAWLLFSIIFMIGMPTSSKMVPAEQLNNPQLTILEVLPDTPAANAGLQVGDVIIKVTSEGTGVEELSRDTVTAFIQEQREAPITIEYIREGETLSETLIPAYDIVDEGVAVGVQMDTVGTLTLNPFMAVIAGFATTIELTVAVAVGLFWFIADLVRGTADLNTVAGPVGIVGLVGDASALGIVYVLQFIAIISLHLAVINLVPFPALDGGRILFVAIEKIKGSAIKPEVVNIVNGIGFILLILLMLVITWNDIARLL